MDFSDIGFDMIYCEYEGFDWDSENELPEVKIINSDLGWIYPMI